MYKNVQADLVTDASKTTHAVHLAPWPNITLSFWSDIPLENQNNIGQTYTRYIVEHTFGLLKSWFQHLVRTGAALLYRPGMVAQM